MTDRWHVDRSIYGGWIAWNPCRFDDCETFARWDVAFAYAFHQATLDRQQEREGAS